MLIIYIASPGLLYFVLVLSAAMLVPEAQDLPIKDELQSLLKAIKRKPSEASLHGQIGLLYQRMGRQTEATKAYRKALKLQPTLVGVHVNLGVITRGKEAEESFRLALEIDPDLAPARHNLGVIRGDRLLQEEKFAEAEENYRLAIAAEPSEEKAIQWASERSTLARLLVRRGAYMEAEAQWRVGADYLEKQGRFPVSQIINFKVIRGEEGWREVLAEEENLFRVICERGEERGIPGSANLPAALKDLRALENSAEWVVAYQRERVSLFGTDVHSSGYGASWFQTWLEIVEDPGISSLFEDDPPQVLISGSGLGEHCLFAAALGARCIGYEVVCDSMVERGKRIIEKHGLSDRITLLCEDATEAAGLESQPVKLAWLNDFVWPVELRKKHWKTLARKLHEGTIVVSCQSDYMPQEKMKDFRLVANATVPYSWDVNQRINIFRKVTPASHVNEL